MSTLCRICTREMPKDRHGLDQVCPKCRKEGHKELLEKSAMSLQDEVENILQYESLTGEDDNWHKYRKRTAITITKLLKNKMDEVVIEELNKFSHTSVCGAIQKRIAQIKKSPRLRKD